MVLQSIWIRLSRKWTLFYYPSLFSMSLIGFKFFESWNSFSKEFFNFSKIIRKKIWKSKLSLAPLFPMPFPNPRSNLNINVIWPNFWIKWNFFFSKISKNLRKQHYRSIFLERRVFQTVARKYKKFNLKGELNA